MAGSPAAAPPPLGRLSAWANVGGCAAGAAWLASLQPTVAAGGAVRLAYEWVPSLGVGLTFYVDGLSILFGLMITVIGAFIALYAGSYLKGHPHAVRFFLYLALFTASMLGLVLADNLITLFVFWELTTVASYLLIGFDHASEKARRNALQALLVTGAGGLALLAGLLLLGAAGGSLELSEIARQGDAVREHALYAPILILVLLGAFTKSAQVPFHFWLPNAMAAPTPVSAYLHSATMVKGGIYLLARLHPTLGGTPEWIWTLTLFGAATAVWASVVALRQTDLKLALAYTTVMALGTLTMFLGSEAKVGIAAAITFMLVHALYKCALFLVVGNIDHGSGTRDAERLGGLARAMPLTAAAAAAAALSMAGFPPFLGFIGKELKYEGALAIASEPVLVAGAAVAANALMVAVAGIVALRPFFGRPIPTPAAPHEVPPAMLIGPLAMAALGLVFGILPPVVGDALVQPAVAAVLGETQTVELALWHGVNLPLVLSAATLALGVAAYRWHGAMRRGLAAGFQRLPITGDGAYDAAMRGLSWCAEVQTRALQTGSLRRYLSVVFATVAVAVGGTLIALDGAVWPSLPRGVAFHEWGVALLVVAGTWLTVAATSRLAAICGLGVVGAGVALIFLMFGAPDVAMTQLLVEILFVVIIAVVLLKLPGFRGRAHPGRAGRTRDAVLAVGAGATVTALMLAVLDGPLSLHVTETLAAWSVPEAHGRNIVNVILVDFRALDTLGEIVVVAVAGLAAFALIKLRPKRRPAP